MIITDKRIFEFFKKVDRSQDKTMCWEWVGYKDRKGYGGFYLSYNKRMERTHRISFFLNSGIWPKDCVLHSCDNPSCVNPYHLREGTHLDNMRDASRKKRFKNQKKTHCKRGHELNEENIYSGRTNRDCRLCREIRGKSRGPRYS